MVSTPSSVAHWSNLRPSCGGFGAHSPGVVRGAGPCHVLVKRDPAKPLATALHEVGRIAVWPSLARRTLSSSCVRHLKSGRVRGLLFHWMLRDRKGVGIECETQFAGMSARGSRVR